MDKDNLANTINTNVDAKLKDEAITKSNDMLETEVNEMINNPEKYPRFKN